MKYILLISMFILTFLDSPAQEGTFPADYSSALQKALSGLSKMDPLKQGNKKMALDVASVTGYLLDGTALRGNQLFKYLSSPDYSADPFVDSLNEVKVLVFRSASASEKLARQQVMSRRTVDSSRVGNVAPTFMFTDMLDNKIDLLSLRGKVIVMNFWFINCKPCLLEIPDLNRLVETFKGKEVVFLGIALDSRKELVTFLSQQEFHYTIIPEGEEVVRSYGISSYPTHIVIDQQGKIIHHSTGLTPSTVSDIEIKIKNALSK